jgi:cellulose biosynthesis protein BcsQ
MAGGNKKIHEHPNAGKNGFDKRPQDAGAKKKLYSEHINDIKNKGYLAPTRQEYFDMVGLLLSMEEQDLAQFSNDKSRPYWIRLIVIDLNNRQTRQKLMSDYRDWLFGKPQQQIDHTTNGKEINITPIQWASEQK